MFFNPDGQKSFWGLWKYIQNSNKCYLMTMGFLNITGYLGLFLIIMATHKKHKQWFTSSLMWSGRSQVVSLSDCRVLLRYYNTSLYQEGQTAGACNESHQQPVVEYHSGQSRSHGQAAIQQSGTLDSRLLTRRTIVRWWNCQTTTTSHKNTPHRLPWVCLTCTQ